MGDGSESIQIFAISFGIHVYKLHWYQTSNKLDCERVKAMRMKMSCKTAWQREARYAKYTVRCATVSSLLGWIGPL